MLNFSLARIELMLCLRLGNVKGTFDEYYIFLYLQKEYQ